MSNEQTRDNSQSFPGRTAQGRAEHPLNCDERRRLRGAQHVRRRDPDAGLAEQRYVKSNRNLLRSPHSRPHSGTPYFAGIEVDIADLDVDELAHAYSSIEEQFEQDLLRRIKDLLPHSIRLVSERAKDFRARKLYDKIIGEPSFSLVA